MNLLTMCVLHGQLSHHWGDTRTVLNNLDSAAKQLAKHLLESEQHALESIESRMSDAGENLNASEREGIRIELRNEIERILDSELATLRRRVTIRAVREEMDG